MRMVPARAGLTGALVAAAVTLPGLGGGTLWDNSETAYGEVAREILISHDWIVMHFNGAPWFVQPPLYFWIAAWFAGFIAPIETALRLPSALATIGMGALTAAAAARAAGQRAGIFAGLVLATMLMQAILGRLAIMDALLDLCVTAAILWLAAAFTPFRPGVRDERERILLVLLAALALGSGTLAKGPVAPVIVALVLGGWLWWESRCAAGIDAPPRLALAAGAVVFAAVVAPWFVAEALRVGPAATRELIGHYTIGRYTGVIENQRGPWWYYLPVLVLGCFPWTAFVPVALVRAAGAAGRREASLLRLALVWIVVPLIFFSCAQTKLPNYVALELPAVAIVLALWFERVANGEDRIASIVSAAAIPVFIALLGVAVTIFLRTNRLQADTSVIVPPLAAMGRLLLAGSLATAVAFGWTRTRAAAPSVLGATALAFVSFIVFVAEPVAESFKPIPRLARAIERERSPETAVAAREITGSNALLFYTRPVLRTLVGPRAEFVRFMCESPDPFVVTRAADAADLVRAVGERGRVVSAIVESGPDVVLHSSGERCSRKPVGGIDQ